MTKQTTTWNRLVIAAAALVVATGAASAQTQTMKAEIPFPFRVSGKLMAAGSYRITPNAVASRPIFILTGAGDSAAALPMTAGDAKASWQAAGNAVLSFTCAGERCALTGLWQGPEQPAYHFATPKLGKDEPARVATIALRPVSGE